VAKNYTTFVRAFVNLRKQHEDAGWHGRGRGRPSGFLKDLAVEEITAKGREYVVGEPGDTAEKIALGAVHFYLLQALPPTT
jgi:hypothetical protein